MVVKHAEAKPLTTTISRQAIQVPPAVKSSGGNAGIAPTCEDYRVIVQKYFGQYADEALIVAGAESRECSAHIADGFNSNGTRDYCIFMINKEPATMKDIDHCVKRASEKFNQSGKVWRWWFAVCPLNKKTGKQYQKWDNIPCFKR